MRQLANNNKIAGDVYSKIVRARTLLERALDYKVSMEAEADIKQALQRIDRLNDVAALLVDKVAPGNRFAEATRALKRKRK